MAENSLINLGDLSKPATVLIEKVCNAVGVLFEPTRIRRQARAEADADKIRALAKIELTSLEERALERLVHQEARKQENIERITAQAASQLPPDAQSDKLDEDWLAHFFKQCDTVSDVEMQSLWARVLSGEATAPGTYSRRTVDLVASMDKSDAAMFTSLGQFVWDHRDPKPLIFDLQASEVQSAGLKFASFKHLDAIGLISFESLAGYRASGLGKSVVMDYFGSPVLLTLPKESGNDLDLGKVMLTSAGKELFRICGASKNDTYFTAVLDRWRKAGISVQVLGSTQP